MHLLVIGYDHPGEAGRLRRERARERHLAQADNPGPARPVFRAAVLDDDGAVIGSMLVMEAASRDDLDAWLRVEPYAVDDVWHEVRIHPCQVPAAFRQPNM